MSVKFSNNGHSTLAASLASNATSITVASGHGARFPSLSSGEYFYATLIDASNNLEIVKVTARSSDVLTATRAQESTTARAYAIGDRIELRVTAAGITDATNIDNIVPSQSGNSGKFLKTDGTNVSFAIAGSTDASYLTSGTLNHARLPNGAVLQVVQHIHTSQEGFSVASGTLSSYSSVQDTITPQDSTNNILVMISLDGVTFETDGGYGHFRLYRTVGGSDTQIGKFGYPRQWSSDDNASGVTMTSFKLDSPGTTSSVTYRFKWFSNSATNTFQINRDSEGNSSMTLMEVKA